MYGANCKPNRALRVARTQLPAHILNVRGQLNVILTLVILALVILNLLIPALAILTLLIIALLTLARRTTAAASVSPFSLTTGARHFSIYRNSRSTAERPMLFRRPEVKHCRQWHRSGFPRRP